jgi:hypothetical protein
MLITASCALSRLPHLKFLVCSRKEWHRCPALSRLFGFATPGVREMCGRVRLSFDVSELNSSFRFRRIARPQLCAELERGSDRFPSCGPL